MSRFRVWDSSNEAEADARECEASVPEEAAEAYVERLSQHESLESDQFDLQVRHLDDPSLPVTSVRVHVDWEPVFYGEVVDGSRS